MPSQPRTGNEQSWEAEQGRDMVPPGGAELVRKLAGIGSPWPLAMDTISSSDLSALAEWLRSAPQLTQGVEVREFERAWSQWLGVRESIFVTSGSMANFALMAVIGRHYARRWPPRVGASAVTWSTNVTPSVLLGHELRLFDIDKRTLGMDPERVCRAMDRGELDVLFVTHLLGFNALNQSILESAERNGVIVLEDCCEAHGARLGSQMVGTLGLASTFSFYYGHHMSTIEGGMISTDDEELADRLRLMRGHGLARESRSFEECSARYSDVDSRFLFVDTGLNLRATEINAFLGLRQLGKLHDRIVHRNKMMSHFLEGLPSSIWRDFETEGMSSFALPLIARDEETATRVRRIVDEYQIESRPVVAGNLLRQPFLRNERVAVAAGDASIADHVHHHGIYIGNGPHVAESMVDALADRLRSECPGE